MLHTRVQCKQFKVETSKLCISSLVPIVLWLIKARGTQAPSTNCWRTVLITKSEASVVNKFGVLILMKVTE